MKLSSTIYLTQKGKEEIALRTCKLEMKKRSILLLLSNTSKTAEEISKNVIIPQNEFMVELQYLEHAGFIVTDPNLINQKTEQATSGTTTVVPVSATTDTLFLEDIIMSEAKYLLTNFCADSFGTNSADYIKELKACSNHIDIGNCFTKIKTVIEKQDPAKLTVLNALVAEINESAD